MVPSQKKIFPTERRQSSRHRTLLSSDHSEDIRGPSISKGCNADSAFCKECCHKRSLINQSQTLLLPASVIHFHLYLFQLICFLLLNLHALYASEQGIAFLWLCE